MECTHEGNDGYHCVKCGEDMPIDYKAFWSNQPQEIYTENDMKDVMESFTLAMKSEGINESTITKIIVTVDDALANNMN